MSIIRIFKHFRYLYMHMFSLTFLINVLDNYK